MNVPGQDRSNIRAPHHVSERGLTEQFAGDGHLLNAGHGRVVHREEGSLRGWGGQLLAQPGELSGTQFAPRLAGDGGVEHDDAQPAEPAHFVEGFVGGFEV